MAKTVRRFKIVVVSVGASNTAYAAPQLEDAYTDGWELWGCVPIVIKEYRIAYTLTRLEQG